MSKKCKSKKKHHWTATSALHFRVSKFVNSAEKRELISPLVCIGQFVEDVKSLLSESEFDFRKKKDFTPEQLSQDMGVDEEVIEELEKVCSPDSLKCQRESEVLNWNNPCCIPTNIGLVTLKHWSYLNVFQYNPEEDFIEWQPYHVHRKYSSLDCALLARASEIQAENDEDRILCPEVVITVSVLLTRGIGAFKSSGADFLVLGSQKLSELRDVIPCTMDHLQVGGKTHIPLNEESVKLKDVCKSSLFYIETRFYTDLRSSTDFDLSKFVMKWAKQNHSCVPRRAGRHRMEKTTFNDLKVRLGCPYTFLHLGDCEHIVLFKDIRLFHASDCQSRSCYPVTVKRGQNRGLVCEVCNMNVSTWYTKYDELALADPALFCERCYKTLHYDKEGKPLGYFKAFPRMHEGQLEY